jgi:hypothetical protein
VSAARAPARKPVELRRAGVQEAAVMNGEDRAARRELLRAMVAQWS